MTDVCIACLSSGIKMCYINNDDLFEVYKNLTTIKLSNEGLPTTMCYNCYSQFQKCCRFMNMAKRAGVILTQLLNDGVQITQETISTINKTSTNSFVTIILKPTSVPSSHTFVEETNPHNDVGVYETDSQTAMKEFSKDNEHMIIQELITIKEEPVDIKLELTMEDELTSETKGPKVITHQADDEISSLDRDLLKPKRKYTKRKDRKRSSIKTHACDICEMKFTCRAYLIRHLRIHTGERPYSCKTCDKKFAQNSHLVQHMRLHSGEKPYTCHVCKNKSFNHRYNYKTHMRKHFGVPSHICDLCNAAFHQKADLKRHIMSHTGERPYTCTICNVKFSQNCHLTKHMRLHNIKTYKCTTCNLSFNLKNEYNNHLVIHPDTIFSCSVEGCSKSFKQKSTLTNHVKTHKVERPHACNKCNKTFKQNSHLVKHIKTVHEKSLVHDIKPNKSDLQINQNEPFNQNVLKLEENIIKNTYLLQEHVEEYIIP